MSITQEELIGYLVDDDCDRFNQQYILSLRPMFDLSHALYLLDVLCRSYSIDANLDNFDYCGLVGPRVFKVTVSSTAWWYGSGIGRSLPEAITRAITHAFRHADDRAAQFREKYMSAPVCDLADLFYEEDGRGLWLAV